MGEVLTEKEEMFIKDQEEDLLQLGKNVLLEEAEGIRYVAYTIGKELVEAAKLVYSCSGRVVVSGLGKSGHVARKTAATLASLGTPAFFLHAAEAVHGDLGMVTGDDVAIIFSFSGNTKEILELIPYFKRVGTPIISVTGNKTSKLAEYSDVVLHIPVSKEACPLGLAPTTSTTVMLAVGDAIASIVVKLKGIRPEDFAIYHPGGSLGKRLLLRVCDCMSTGERVPVVSEGVKLKDAIFEITSKGFGTTAVVDENGNLKGIFTDGDLRRTLEKYGVEAFNKPISEVMTLNPKVISPKKLAVEALKLMEENEISVLLVVDDDNKKLVGIVHLHDLLRMGVA